MGTIRKSMAAIVFLAVPLLPGGGCASEPAAVRPGGEEFVVGGRELAARFTEITRAPGGALVVRAGSRRHVFRAGAGLAGEHALEVGLRARGSRVVHAFRVPIDETFGNAILLSPRAFDAVFGDAPRTAASVERGGARIDCEAIDDVELSIPALELTMTCRVHRAPGR